VRSDNALAIIARIIRSDTNYGAQEAEAYARGVRDTLCDEHGTRGNPFANMAEKEVEELARRLVLI
jgi:hypothetical protein